MSTETAGVRITEQQFDVLLNAYSVLLSQAVVGGKPAQIEKAAQAYVELRKAVFG